MKVSGKTSIFLTIAHPVAHLAAPEIFASEFAGRAIDAVMIGADVLPEHLREFVGAMRKMANLKGFCVTVPHKQAVMLHLDRLTPEAIEAGAVNVVRRDPDGTLTGHQLDGEGFVVGLAEAGHELKGRRVFLAGAGGAATGIAFALARSGVAQLRIFNRTTHRAEALAARVRASQPGLAVEVGDDDPAGFDLVVNATSAGLHPADPLPIVLEGVGPQALVAEVIMRPRETKLISAARARGLRVHYGESMLTGQLRPILEFWGVAPSAPGTDRRASA